jgi:hypothetical protein
MTKKGKKKCTHRHDPTTICWGKDGVRGFPCKKCGTISPIGTIAVRKPQ